MLATKNTQAHVQHISDGIYETEKIHEGGKALLPLVKLHFLAPTEE